MSITIVDQYEQFFRLTEDFDSHTLSRSGDIFFLRVPTALNTTQIIEYRVLYLRRFCFLNAKDNFAFTSDIDIVVEIVNREEKKPWWKKLFG